MGGPVAVLALAVACAVLSVFVVARRWAFIGEGIAHAWYGGAGTAWMLATVAWPGVATGWGFHLVAVGFCLLVAMGIGRVARGSEVSADAAIGMFLAASLAWGFLWQTIYMQHHAGAVAVSVNDALFGNLRGIGGAQARATVVLAVGVIGVVWALGRQILFYCLDPVLAEVSGVPAGVIHYLLIAVIAVMILAGVQVTGVVLVPAMLILPGATAGVVTKRLRATFLVAVGVAVIGVVMGLVVGRVWPVLPEGPLVVLGMFLVFVGAWVGRGWTKRRVAE